MSVLHLGGSPLGDRIREVLRDLEPELAVADEPESLARATEGVRTGELDWIISSGYRWILPDAVLSLAKDTCNVHTSLLPWGRGAHPNVWAIVDHEPVGVSLHRMVPAVDAGPIFAQRRVETSFADTGAVLHRRLEDTAVEFFTETWPSIREGRLEPSPQEGEGSYHRVRDLDGLRTIDLEASVSWRRALDVLRALTFPPYRNAAVEVDGRRYHVEISVTDVTLED